MVNVEYLDGPALHRWLTRAVAELVARRAEINKLNVFPVPDADTGSNMAHTMEAALAEVNDLPASHQRDITKLTAAIAVGAVKGARGNSGMVLSQVLRGLAQSAVSDRITGRTVQQALTTANKFVHHAIIEPVEGTVVTVLRAAAIAANQAPTDSLIDVLTAATTAAAIALANTPSQLAVLRDAGVVDAGAQGLVLLLETMLDEVSGGTIETSTNPSFQPPKPKPLSIKVVGTAAPGSIDMFTQLLGATRITAPTNTNPTQTPQPQQGKTPPKPRSPFGQPTQLARLWNHQPPTIDTPPTTTTHTRQKPHTDTPNPTVPTETTRPRVDYLEVMFFIQNADLNHVRDQLQPLGDSFIIAPISPHSASVHIHTHQAGTVIETAHQLGKITNLHIEALPEATTTSHRIILALTPTGLITHLYQSAGALTINPGDDIVLDIAAAARASGATEIILLPNGMLTTHQLASIERSSHAFEQALTIVPTGTIIRGLAALAACNNTQPLAVDAYTMGEAAQATRTARIITDPTTTEIHAITNDKNRHPTTLCTTTTLHQAIAHTLTTLIDPTTRRVTILIDETAPEFSASDLPKFHGVEIITYRTQNLGSLAEIGVE
ncbi:DAK2 domain-containing protein [uncultured Corynebacterium sp.]|uniref:DAK2 domain-containing protein n=1 Tax=uncultured Corynebacterium sp. TaxID=159447 RepID=UPI0028D4FB55|nr:DAK2 domain-containing protein [uncultured Corynebacterium sp.]